MILANLSCTLTLWQFHQYKPYLYMSILHFSLQVSCNVRSHRIAASAGYVADTIWCLFGQWFRFLCFINTNILLPKKILIYQIMAAKNNQNYGNVTVCVAQ